MLRFYKSIVKSGFVFAGMLMLGQVYCNSTIAQQFTAGRLVVERVGNGTPQSAAGTQIYLDEYTIGGAAGASIPMPVTTSGVVNRTVESGTSTSCGFITRSQDGKYIVVPGYDAAVGTPSVSTTMLNKVISRVDANGNVSSTVLTDATAFSGNSIRGVASTDGSDYWLSGAGNGPLYVVHQGNTTPVAATEISNSLIDNRCTYIFNSQLYQSTISGPTPGVFNVGVGLPTTSGQPMTTAVGLSPTGDPYQFVIVNNGLPVMYVSDYANKLVRKYFQLGPTWYFAGATTVTLGGVATGFYGITGNVSGGAVRLYLTTTNIIGSNSRIVTFSDFTSASTTITGSTAGTTIVGPTTNTAFHGIAFVPFNVTSISAASAAVCTGSGTNITIYGTPGASVVYKINSFPQPAVTIASDGTYSFSTGALTASTTYTVISATDGSLTQTYAYGVIVNVNPLPTVTISGTANICAGAPTTLTAGGASTYTWAPGATLSATTGTSVTASPTVNTTYTVTGTDINGCVNRRTLTVTTNPIPTIGASSSVAICAGASTTLSASGGVNYSWSPASGVSATTGNAIIATPATTTTYTVTGTNVIGCTNTKTVTVTVNPLPVVTASPNVTVCNGLPSVLLAGGASTYVWSPATGLSATTGSTVTAIPSTTTNYTVTGTDGNGCMNSASVQVSVNPLPVVTTNPSSAICIGNNIGLIASGAVDYSWSPATGLSETTGSSVVATPTVTTTYSVTGVDINGCINGAIVTVTVNPLPVISTSTPVAICIGSYTNLAASGGVTYSWAPATGLSAVTGNIVVASPSVNTTYTITGTDANGCVNTITNTVTVNPLPVVTASPGVVMCYGANTVLAASGANTYVWLPGTGLSAIAGSSVTASPASTTTYTVYGTDVNGCIGTSTVTVAINPLPVISAGGTVTLCQGFSAGLTATGAVDYTWLPATGLSATTGSNPVANPTVTTTYTVTGTDGNGCVNKGFVTVGVYPLPYVSSTGAGICPGSSTALTAVSSTPTLTWSPAASLSTSMGTSVVASPASTTTYTITATSAYGCVSQSTVTVTVYPLPPISAGPGVAICNGSSTTLTATGSVTYSWAPGYGLSVTTGNTVMANPRSTTTYTITGIDRCVNSTTITVTVNPLPVITAPGATICMGQSATLSATGATTYSWAPGTGLSGVVGSSVTASPTANTNYTVTGTDANGCVNKTVATVLVNLIPVITTGPSVTICNRATTTLSAFGGSTYSWSPATGLSSTVGSSVSASPSSTTVYTVTGTSPYGCSSQATVAVNVNGLPIVYPVTGGGTFCAGGIGVPVGLAGSQGGINYELFVGSISAGITRFGTGSAIDFGHPGTSGYYTIKGTNTATGCSDTMSGGAGIIINHGPVALAVTGGGSYCPDAPGVRVGLAGSVTGVLYQLYRDSIAIDTPVAGSGSPLDFGIHSTAGTYTATAVNAGMTCVTNMLGSADINVLSMPPVFAVTGGGTYCEGDPGVHIGIIGSQIGMRYGVYLGTTPMAPSLIGMGTSLDFGLFTTPGVYTVTSTNSATGCSDTMSGTATVSMNPTPVITGDYLILRHTTTTLNATPAGGTWTSSSPTVATVNSSGIVTGVGLGRTTITYTLPTGCDDVFDVTVNPNLGVRATLGGSSLMLVPNPNNGVFSLTGTVDNSVSEQVSIEIVNSIGQVVYNRNVTVNDRKLNEHFEIKNAAPGMYVLTVRTGEGSTQLRFIKE